MWPGLAEVVFPLKTNAFSIMLASFAQPKHSKTSFPRNTLTKENYYKTYAISIILLVAEVG